MAFLVSFFGAVGIVLGWMQAAERASQDRDWQAVMDPQAADPGLAPADDVPTDRARRVTVGLYLERITEVAKTFHIHNFPLDRHLLVLAFEDGSGQREKLLFEPDVVNSDISSRAAVHGYRLGTLTAVEKPHSYKTTQGRPGLAPGTRSTFSQARFGLVIARDSWGPFVKMFHALFVAVAIALLPCFIRPSGPDPARCFRQALALIQPRHQVSFRQADTERPENVPQSPTAGRCDRSACQQRRRISPRGMRTFSHRIRINWIDVGAMSRRHRSGDFAALPRCSPERES